MANIFVRHEKKFLINNEIMKLILDKFGDLLEVDPYTKKDGYSHINNIYFDTVNNDVIRESVSRPIYKEKLRLRSYHVLEDENEKVYLEIKKKFDGTGNKRRIPLTYKEAMDFVLKRKFPESITNDYVTNQIGLEIEQFLRRNKVIPAIYISSKRKAFYGKNDPEFRLTFDFDVKYRTDNVNLLSDVGKNFLKDDEIIALKKTYGLNGEYIQYDKLVDKLIEIVHNDSEHDEN